MRFPRIPASFNPKLAVLSLSHFVNDIHGVFLPTFLPIIVENLGISYAQAGLLKSLSGFMHMIVQPMSGYLSDLFRRPWALIIGPLFTSLGATMLPAAPTYAVSFLLVGLHSIGSAVYHPLGHGGVGYVVPSSKLAFSLSIFAVGGILGGTMSPLYAIFLYRTFGPVLLPVVALIPVIGTGYLVYRFIPLLKEGREHSDISTANFMKTLWVTYRQILPVWSVAMCRDTSVQGIKFFLPLLIASRGGNLVNIGSILFIISIAGAVTPMMGGKLADSIGRRKVIAFAMIGGPCFMIPAAVTSGVISIALFTAGNALLQAILPVTGAAAQEMAPRHRSVVAALVTGLSFGLGGLLLAPIGAMADSMGLIAALVFLGVLPLLPMPMFFVQWRRIGVPAGKE
ncbi:MAG: MFS transporter [Synergistota bacterium]|nr:MFS transporter [Synergistota bacterium]